MLDEHAGAVARVAVAISAVVLVALVVVVVRSGIWDDGDDAVPVIRIGEPADRPGRTSSTTAAPGPEIVPGPIEPPLHPPTTQAPLPPPPPPPPPADDDESDDNDDG